MQNGSSSSGGINFCNANKFPYSRYKRIFIFFVAKLTQKRYSFAKNNKIKLKSFLTLLFCELFVATNKKNLLMWLQFLFLEVQAPLLRKIERKTFWFSRTFIMFLSYKKLNFCRQSTGGICHMVHDPTISFMQRYLLIIRMVQ